MCLRVLLGISAAVLLFVRFYWPKVEIDVVTVLLVMLLAAALCWPSVRSALPFIKGVNVAGVEVSLGDAVKELASKAEKAEEEKKVVPTPEVAPKSLADEVDEVDTVARTSPEAAILLLSAKLERALRNLAATTPLGDRAARLTLPVLTRALDEAGVLGHSTVAALNDFRAIRNQLAHGVDASPVDLDHIISIGNRLLTTVASREDSGDQSS